MSTASVTEATFRITYLGLGEDHTLCVLGSETTLGEWDVDNPAYAQHMGGDLWEASVNLTPGVTVFWSCLILDRRGRFIRRESRPRRRVLMIEQDTSKIEVVGEWNKYMEVKQLKRSEPEVIDSHPSMWSGVLHYFHLGGSFSSGLSRTQPQHQSARLEGYEVDVVFRIERQLQGEERVLAIIGSHRALGEWNLTKAAVASDVGNYKWEARVRLTPNSVVFWSCVTLDEFGQLHRRESAPKRRKLLIEAGSPNFVLNCAWDQETVVARRASGSTGSLGSAISNLFTKNGCSEKPKRSKSQMESNSDKKDRKTKKVKSRGEMELGFEDPSTRCEEPGYRGQIVNLPIDFGSADPSPVSPRGSVVSPESPLGSPRSLQSADSSNRSVTGSDVNPSGRRHGAFVVGISVVTGVLAAFTLSRRLW